jgi:hypothetical protein
MVCRGVKDAWKKIAAKEYNNKVTNKNVLAITAKAIQQGVTASNIISGFRACGIWPLDPQRLLKSVGLDFSTLSEEIADSAAEIKQKEAQGKPVSDGDLHKLVVAGGQLRARVRLLASFLPRSLSLFLLRKDDQRFDDDYASVSAAAAARG